MKQFITFYTTVSSRLTLCKILKNHLEIGLKEAKELMNSCLLNLEVPHPINFNSPDKRPSLIKDLNTELPDLKFKISGDIQDERSKFFLDMDMGEKEDYVKFLSENYMYLLYNKSTAELQSMMYNIVSRLDIESLKNLYEGYCEKEELDIIKSENKKSESTNDDSWL